MDPTQQSAAEYYKNHRRRSRFSRLTIISSMAILLVVLGINITALYSQDKSTTESHASTPQNVENLLPSLPHGCTYVHVNGNEKVKVDCSKNSPTTGPKVPINVMLPNLPSGCSFVTTTTGSEIQCTTIAPIPTVPVHLPATCAFAKEPNTVTCTYGNNQTVTQTLPKLPDGCSYFLGANQYFVVCEAK